MLRVSGWAGADSGRGPGGERFRNELPEVFADFCRVLAPGGLAQLAFPESDRSFCYLAYPGSVSCPRGMGPPGVHRQARPAASGRSVMKPSSGRPSSPRNARARHRMGVIAGAAVLAATLGGAVSVLSATPGSHAVAVRPLSQDSARPTPTATPAPTGSPAPTDVLLSQGQLAYASSTQNAPLPQYEPWYAKDGDMYTRWASN
jgi:hypothetical protein